MTELEFWSVERLRRSLELGEAKNHALMVEQVSTRRSYGTLQALSRLIQTKFNFGVLAVSIGAHGEVDRCCDSRTCC